MLTKEVVVTEPSVVVVAVDEGTPLEVQTARVDGCAV